MQKCSRTIGYLRVSITDPSGDTGKSNIYRLANDKKLRTVNWVCEKPIGKQRWNRRQIARVIDDLGAGDNLIVLDLSSLGRSMLECMEILAVTLEKQINFYTVKGDWQLDGAISLKSMAMAFSMAAEIERDKISQRTKKALATIKKRGGRLGRPKGTGGKSKLDPFKQEIQIRLNNGSTQKFIARRYNVTEATLSRWLKRHRLKKPVF